VFVFLVQPVEGHGWNLVTGNDYGRKNDPVDIDVWDK
jgi:hypothetical protein